jgi:hypothetical protein
MTLEIIPFHAEILLITVADLIGVEGSRLRLREASRALQAAPSKFLTGGAIIWSILIYVEYLV